MVEMPQQPETTRESVKTHIETEAARQESLSSLSSRWEASWSRSDLRKLLDGCSYVRESLAKLYNSSIRRAIIGDFQQRFAGDWQYRIENYSYHGGKLGISPFREAIKRNPFTYQPNLKSERVLLQTSGAEQETLVTIDLAFKVDDPWSFPKTSLIFSVSDDTAKRHYSDGPFGTFCNPFELRYLGSFYQQSFGSARARLSEMSEEDLLGVTFKGADVESFLETLKIDATLGVDAANEMGLLGSELNSNSVELEKVCEAVRNYAQFVKPPPESAVDEVGRCLTVPDNFANFCREWYNFEIGIDHYHVGVFGGKPDSGNPQYFFHQVNIAFNEIVIDWTARQFTNFSSEIYPLIYRPGDARIPSGWEVLRKRSYS